MMKMNSKLIEEDAMTIQIDTEKKIIRKSNTRAEEISKLKQLDLFSNFIQLNNNKK